MCTSDAWRHRDSMEQCSGDLWYSEALEEGAVSALLWQLEGLQDNTRSKAAEWACSAMQWPCSLRAERVFTKCCVIQGP